MNFRKLSAKAKINLTCRWLWFPYLFMVLWLTFFNRTSTSHCLELTPFWEYHYLFTGTSYERQYYFRQIGDNILLFIPFGFMLPTIFKKYRQFKLTFFTAFIFSVFIEILQLVTARGLCEFDDVFNNTLGAVIGFCIFKILKAKMLKRSN